MRPSIGPSSRPSAQRHDPLRRRYPAIPLIQTDDPEVASTRHDVPRQSPDGEHPRHVAPGRGHGELLRPVVEGGFQGGAARSDADASRRRLRFGCHNRPNVVGEALRLRRLADPSPPWRRSRRPITRSQVHRCTLFRRRRADRSPATTTATMIAPASRAQAARRLTVEAGSRPKPSTPFSEKQCRAAAGPTANPSTTRRSARGSTGAEHAGPEDHHRLVQDREDKDVHRCREDHHPQDGKDTLARPSTSTLR